jgi:hypothetical protein
MLQAKTYIFMCGLMDAEWKLGGTLMDDESRQIYDLLKGNIHRWKLKGSLKEA